MLSIIKEYSAELDNANFIEERIIAKFNKDVAIIVADLERALTITKATDRPAIVKGIRMLQDNILKRTKQDDTLKMPWDD